MNEPSTYIKVFLERQMFMRKFTNNFHLRFCILFCKSYTRSEICNIYLLIPKNIVAIGHLFILLINYVTRD